MSARVGAVALYVLITFSASWIAYAASVSVISSVAPALVAITLTIALQHKSVWKSLGLSLRFNRWWIIAWLLPGLLAVGAGVVGLLVPGTTFSPGNGLAKWLDSGTRIIAQTAVEQEELLQNQWPSVMVVMLMVGLLAGATLGAVRALGEELGWRGWLLAEVAPLGFWKSSLFVGVIWGLWHAPAIFADYPRRPLEGVLMMVLVSTAASPLISYLRLRANSVIPAALFHGSLNFTLPVSAVLAQGGSDLTTGIFGLSGLAVFLTADVCIWLRMRRTGEGGTLALALQSIAATVDPSIEVSPRRPG